MTISAVQFVDMPQIKIVNKHCIRVFGRYVCHCRWDDNVWVAKTRPRACGKCKRLTWDRDDERYKAARRRKKKK